MQAFSSQVSEESRHLLETLLYAFFRTVCLITRSRKYIVCADCNAQSENKRLYRLVETSSSAWNRHGRGLAGETVSPSTFLPVGLHQVVEAWLTRAGAA